ncbi:response regulator transcription factor [Exilibacterium tricleocarpae]|uniref:Response regulator transcription factor n=1 Tax=Exilibacterium tricleocarpae TaxID=2591008 RepID=A0A545TZD6_9GAMM|nr:response regulator transcription factor [Exilibacterium tricleocarpae]TQV82580.1 response regulator transcription factor [Exilibacterium tricleocarpae]
MSTDTKMIIADDHPLFRTALQQTLQAELTLPAPPQLLQADSIDAVHGLLGQHPDTDLVLLDLHMPGAHGFSGLANLRGVFPTIPIAIISASDQPHVVRQAADLGASGFIPKTLAPAALGRAVADLLAGATWFTDALNQASEGIDQATAQFAERLANLTPHQFRVYTMITEGMLNKQIAYDLNISEPTVKAHVTAILRKLGVRDRKQVIIAAGALAVEDAANSL